MRSTIAAGVKKSRNGWQAVLLSLLNSEFFKNLKSAAESSGLTEEFYRNVRE